MEIPGAATGELAGGELAADHPIGSWHRCDHAIEITRWSTQEEAEAFLKVLQDEGASIDGANLANGCVCCTIGDDLIGPAWGCCGNLRRPTI